MPLLEFADPAGLLLLALIPLLLLFRRRKERPRRVVLPSLFLLLALRRRQSRATLRLLRLSRAQRLAVIAAILASLSLALAGATLVLRRAPPERWLLVVDNTPVAAAQVAGVAVGEAVREFLAQLPLALVAGDLVTVVTTSPVPALRTFGPGAALREHLAAIAPAQRSGSLEDAVALIEDLAPRHQRALVLSPRAGAWRRLVRGRRLEGRLTIPADRAVARGNRGIVLARARVSTAVEGRYDLFVAVRSGIDADGDLPVRLVPPGPSPATVALRGGEGRLLLESLALPAGELRVELPGGDAFAGDDRLRLTVPAAAALAVAVHGGRPGVLEAAVGAHAGFQLAPAERAQVEIYSGQAPEQLARPALLICPVRDQQGVRVHDLVPVRGEPRWHPDHAVTRALRGGAFRPAKVQALEFDAAYASLAEVDGLPLLLAGERQGQRFLVWAFDPLDGGLFARPEFVILLRESLDWLGGRSEIPPTPAPDRRTTEDAAEVTLPDPGRAFLARERTGRQRQALAPWLVGAALLLGVLLAASDLVAPAEAGAEAP
jgi:hypothetical protein